MYVEDSRTKANYIRHYMETRMYTHTLHVFVIDVS